MTPDKAPSPTPPLLHVDGLRVVLPGGETLLDGLSLTVRPGEVVALLGGSGAGKSTFARVLFEPESLERDGWLVESNGLTFDRADLGLVPQRGALFDHLDVRGNLDLALRHAPVRVQPGAKAIESPGASGWLEKVGLPRELGKPGQEVARLSGGQAQRVAVARALAAGRRLLFLDEPSVGLDPHRVRLLARLIREQCERLSLAVVVVTHDVALAAGVADRLLVLDPATRKLEELFAGSWPGPMERPAVADEERGRWMVALEKELVDRIERGAAAPGGPPGTPGRREERPGPRRHLLRELFAPFGVAATALTRIPGQLARRPRDFFTIAGRILSQTVLRPLPFYVVVSALLGYTVLFVISKIGGAGVLPSAGIRLVGGSYVIALAPALSAILFVAASGNAANAWLGSMQLTRQVLALEALGIDSRAYLWAPIWLSLAVGYAAIATLFGAGMIAGGLALCHQLGIKDGFALLTSDLVDPRPERVRYVVRALFLVWIYAWGIASDVVEKGAREKHRSDEVTRAMTASVVACTVWLVLWELVTAMAVFSR